MQMNCSLCWKTSSRCFTRMQPLWMSSVTLVSTESAVAITSFASSVSLSRRFLFVPVPETKHVKPRSALFPKKQAESGTFPCHGTESFHFLLNPYPRAWGLTTPPSNPSCLSEQNQDQFGNFPWTQTLWSKQKPFGSIHMATSLAFLCGNNL